MSTQENKRIIAEIFDGFSRRDGAMFAERLADNASWVVTGSNSWSHRFKGKDAIYNQLFSQVRSQLTDRMRSIAQRVIAEDDLVVVEARGDNIAKSGARYDNHYCLVFQLADGKIVEVREYMDSALAEAILGPFPESKRPA
jgi:ketosteroid isomerase-like protein